MKPVTDPSDLENNHVFEVTGSCGCGKSTFVRNLGEFYASMGNKVYYFRRTPNEKIQKGPEYRGYSTFYEMHGVSYRFADHEDHIVHLCQHGVIEPDLIILDEFYARDPESKTPEGLEKIYSYLEELAIKYNCKFIMTRQCGTPSIDKVEIFAHIYKTPRFATYVETNNRRPY